MNANEPNTRASDEVVSAEAELLAAQEALEAARARLAELKSEPLPADSGSSAAASSEAPCSGEEAVEVAAVIVDGETSQVEAVIFEASPVCDPVRQPSAGMDADAGKTPFAEGVPAPVASAPMEDAAAPDVSAPAPASGEPLPEWVPYSTAPSGTQSGAAPVAAPQPAPAAPAGEYYSYQQQPQQPQQPYAGYTGPGYDQAPHAGPGAVPPQQPYYGYQYQQPYYQQPYQSMVSPKDHVAAGLLAIFLGQLGIHKFYLGYNTSGFIMLAVTIIGSIFTFGLAAGVMWVIAIIEGILYLTKSQSEFEQTYVVNKREWF